MSGGEILRPDKSELRMTKRERAQNDRGERVLSRGVKESFPSQVRRRRDPEQQEVKA